MIACAIYVLVLGAAKNFFVSFNALCLLMQSITLLGLFRKSR